jgi:4-hydroxybenzoate polyprenyltransferase
MKKTLKTTILFLQLIRYQNLMIMILTLFFVKYFLIPPFSTPLPSGTYFFLISAVVLIAAGGYIINDVYDITIDKINKPSKVLIDSTFSKTTAFYFYAIFNAIGLLFAFLISFQIGWIHGLCAFSLWLYARYLKKNILVGNAVVAFLSAFVVLIINILHQSHFPLVYAFALFAFFIALIRELVKDIEDMEGDAIAACRTFPLVFGIFKTKILVYCLIAFFILILFGSRLLGIFPYKHQDFSLFAPQPTKEDFFF